MKKIFYVQIIIYILYSLEQNEKEIPEDKKTLDNIEKEIRKLNLDSAISNISNLFQNQIISLTKQINDLINTTLNTQEQIFKNYDNDQIMIKDMLSQIKNLKKRYRRNMIFSYFIGCIILFTFFVFYCTDYLNGRKIKKYIGYKRATQEQNDISNNQIDIE